MQMAFRWNPSADETAFFLGLRYCFSRKFEIIYGIVKTELKKKQQTISFNRLNQINQIFVALIQQQQNIE